ncbi:MAG: gliding motility-associated protein GldE [Muribaculaceae bacterium]|nr:gliding motility-associated protein GldE [Muribaculaceae bacterium]MDE6392544.1 gliding motility-associated protein GldE [Muribaculaceae bacterium]
MLLSAFVSGSEIAFFGLSPQEIDDLEESEDAGDARAFRLIRNPERLLATILIANNLVNITMVVVLTFAINQVVRFNSSLVSFLVQTVFMTFLLLLFGEIFPKLVARGRTLKWVRMAVPGISLLYALFGPLARIMVRSTFIVNRIVTKKEENISTDELEKALEISDVQEGKDKELLEGILSFGEREAREIMISRVDVTSLEFHDSWDEAVGVILDSGYSRIPVYDTSQDSICGILYSKDLLPYIGKTERPEWQSLIREAYFVPESRVLGDLLEDFRKRKMHIAIVIDEYGCTQGIVTLEDVIEEIVGDIDDEYDEADRLYRKIAPDTYIFEAKMALADFCRVLDIEEDSLGEIGDAETLAGLLLEIKGDFPTTKEIFERGPLRLQVIQMEKHRIVKVKVTLIPAAVG